MSSPHIPPSGGPENASSPNIFSKIFHQIGRFKTLVTSVLTWSESERKKTNILYEIIHRWSLPQDLYEDFYELLTESEIQESDLLLAIHSYIGLVAENIYTNTIKINQCVENLSLQEKQVLGYAIQKWLISSKRAQRLKFWEQYSLFYLTVQFWHEDLPNELLIKILKENA